MLATEVGTMMALLLERIRGLILSNVEFVELFALLSVFASFDSFDSFDSFNSFNSFNSFAYERSVAVNASLGSSRGRHGVVTAAWAPLRSRPCRTARRDIGWGSINN